MNEICLSCGVHLQKDALYCGECGTKRESKPSCPEFVADSLLCSECVAPSLAIGSVENATIDSTAKSKEDSIGEAIKVLEAKTADIGKATEQQPSSSSKASSGSSNLVMGIVIIAVICVGAFFFMRNQPVDQAAQQTPHQSSGAHQQSSTPPTTGVGSQPSANPPSPPPTLAIRISSNISTAELLVNGERTNRKIYEIDSSEYSVEQGATLVAFVNLAGTPVYSNGVTVTNTGNVSLIFSVNEDLRNQVVDTLIDFNCSYLNALYNRNAALLSALTETRRSVTDAYIKGLVNSGQYHRGTLQKISVDFDSVTLAEIDRRLFMTADVQETFYSTFYTAGANQVWETRVYSIRYSLIYDDMTNSWLVDSDSRIQQWNPRDPREVIVNYTGS